MAKRKHPTQQISIIVPFGGTDHARLRAWDWLFIYLRDHLPEAEIIIGRDKSSERRCWRKHPRPFSKARAVNNAFKRTHGDIIVILDADAYIDTKVLEQVAARLRAQRSIGNRRWFVPFTHLYRLTKDFTDQILRSDPSDPLVPLSPPRPSTIESTEGSGPLNIFGAMCIVLPREAFDAVGGMDPRFIGWGGEDLAFAQALDTIWGPMQTTANDIYHLWHPRITAPGDGPDWTVKMWAGQGGPGANNWLSAQYQRAYRDPNEMARILRDGRRAK